MKSTWRRTALCSTSPEPRDADAKAYFALLLYRTAKTPKERLRAYQTLREALGADLTRNDVRRALAQAGSGF